jgi:hypothetical protein
MNHTDAVPLHDIGVGWFIGVGTAYIIFWVHMNHTDAVPIHDIGVGWFIGMGTAYTVICVNK